ncbi:MAG: TM0106 family RecB-like putative nuclease [Geitlerinemataceae cyanobacterium]
MLVSSDLLLHFQRCRRRAFLDIYGDDRRKTPSENFLLKLREDSQAHRELELSEYPYVQPDYARGQWRDGVAQTIELMQAGTPCIYRGAIAAPWDSSTMLLGKPDLLVRTDRPSELGGWSYICKDIRFGKRPKLDYQIVSIFNSFVLASVQGAWPETAEIALRDRGVHRVDFQHRRTEALEVTAQCVETLRDRREPDLFLSRQKCSLCQWHGECHRTALRTRHLSLLPGVTPNRYTQLEALKLRAIDDVFALPFERLALAVGAESADRIYRQARASLSNVAIPLALPVSLAGDPPALERALADPSENFLPAEISPERAIADFPDADIELHFDIEAEPDREVDFLFGVLAVDRRTGAQTFHEFLAETPEDEGYAWNEFVSFVLSHPDAPIYHFCDYEVKTIARMARRYGTPLRQWQAMADRCVDLHWWATQTVAMPVESYSLKAMARWLGFAWRDSEANGAQCICWYNDWLESGDRHHLDRIVLYNEDDCRATYRLKVWLEQFLRVPAMAAHLELECPRAIAL